LARCTDTVNPVLGGYTSGKPVPLKARQIFRFEKQHYKTNRKRKNREKSEQKNRFFPVDLGKLKGLVKIVSYVSFNMKLIILYN